MKEEPGEALLRTFGTSLKEVKQGAMWVRKSREFQIEEAARTKVLRRKCAGMLKKQAGFKKAGEGSRRASLLRDEVKGP